MRAIIVKDNYTNRDVVINVDHITGAKEGGDGDACNYITIFWGHTSTCTETATLEDIYGLLLGPKDD